MHITADFSKGLKPRPLAMNMIKERLYRRLEKLEDERIPDDPTQIINVCYVNTDGSPAGGYQVVLPLLPRHRSGTGVSWWSRSRGR